MAAIKIDNLSVSGAEFFSDSESYLDELSESDVLTVKGGTGVTIRYFTWFFRVR
ncbi:MAG: hypothetical protein RIG63_25745 [Coleofasciculus chthonoplastes F3-SA18-01]|uniref:hypothetical protein n=1 Tax=Coleofasciculus chthonoplastes TaxID=64178 RepID=UPI0032F48B49